jgi:symplekin
MSTSGMALLSFQRVPSHANGHSDPHGPLAMRIQQYVERLIRSRTEIFEEAGRKRGPPEPVDGLESAKRQRLGASLPTPAPKLVIPPFPPGPHTVAELFTITQDEGLKAFDVSQLSEDLVVKIGVTIMSRLNENLLKQAISVSASLLMFKLSNH